MKYLFVPKRMAVIFSLLFFITSCRVSLVPEYSAQLETQIANAAKANDRLYIDMLDVLPAQRTYDTFAVRYNDIEAEINSIQLKNEARKKNNDFMVIIKNLKDAFTEAKNYHKTNRTISNGEIKAYQATLAGFWKPLYIAEKALKD